MKASVLALALALLVTTPVMSEMIDMDSAIVGNQSTFKIFNDIVNVKYASSDNVVLEVAGSEVQISKDETVLLSSSNTCKSTWIATTDCNIQYTYNGTALVAVKNRI